MSHPGPALARLVLVLCVLAPESGAAQSKTDVAVRDVLATIGRPPTVVRAIDELALLGPAALAPLFESLCASAQGAAPLGKLQIVAIHGALERLPREAWLAVLAREARTGDGHRREASLGVLARLGGRAELPLAFELGTPGRGESPPGSALLQALEQALLGMCARDEATVRALATFFPRAHPAAQASVAAVVARAGGESAPGLLADQLGRAGVDADVILLLALAELGGRRLSGEDTQVFERVRGNLGHPDARLRVLACLAVEKLRDLEAVPDLVVLLDDHDANLRKRAHAALTSLTGLRLPAESEPWLSWLSDGLSWWDERAEPCRIALVSGAPAEAAASVRELARQRLFAHHSASILALALSRPELDIVKSACRALGTIPERTAIEALLSVLVHPDPTVVGEARAALRRLERARSSDTRHSPSLPRLKNQP